jgi:hypothetical protein
MCDWMTSLNNFDGISACQFSRGMLPAAIHIFNQNIFFCWNKLSTALTVAMDGLRYPPRLGLVDLLDGMNGCNLVD